MVTWDFAGAKSTKKVVVVGRDKSTKVVAPRDKLLGVKRNTRFTTTSGWGWSKTVNIFHCRGSSSYRKSIAFGPSTTTSPYAPTAEVDNGSATPLECISPMPSYKQKKVKKVRWEDQSGDEGAAKGKQTADRKSSFGVQQGGGRWTPNAPTVEVDAGKTTPLQCISAMRNSKRKIVKKVRWADQSGDQAQVKQIVGGATLAFTTTPSMLFPTKRLERATNFRQDPNILEEVNEVVLDYIKSKKIDR